MSKEDSARKLSTWKERIAEWQDSKLSISQWCKENTVTIDTFRYWREKVDQSTTVPRDESSSGFIELCSDDSYNKAEIELCFKDVVIKIARDFEDATLTRLLSLLRREM